MNAEQAVHVVIAHFDSCKTADTDTLDALRVLQSFAFNEGDLLARYEDD